MRDPKVGLFLPFYQVLSTPPQFLSARALVLPHVLITQAAPLLLAYQFLSIHLQLFSVLVLPRVLFTQVELLILIYQLLFSKILLLPSHALPAIITRMLIFVRPLVRALLDLQALLASQILFIHLQLFNALAQLPQ